MILLTPGPCMTSETVRAAAAARDMNHREPEYQELFAEVRSRLVSVYEGSTDWQPFILGGSGTAAVEAMLTSCISLGATLVLENGYYSSRLGDILEAHRMPFERLSFPWDARIDPGELEKRLAQSQFEAVVATHNETTTGRLNDLAALGKVCQRHGVKFLVDAMSSFGVEPIPFDLVSAVCASANKCLHGLPGVSFVLCPPHMCDALAAISPRSYYLALQRYAGDSPSLTPPVQAMAAFRQALRELPSGAQPAGKRRSEYAKRMELARSELDRRGFVPLLAPEDSSVTVATYHAPAGWTAPQWIDANLSKGYMLYGTKGYLRDTHFQVSVMGELQTRHITGWLDCVDELLAKSGTA